MSSSSRAVWIVVPVCALLLGAVVWGISSIPEPSIHVPVPPAPAADLAPPAAESLPERRVPVRTTLPAAALPVAPVAVTPVLTGPGVVTEAALQVLEDAQYRELRDQIHQQAVETYEPLREKIVAYCLPNGGRARVTFQLVVDAEGQQLARGLSEDRNAYVEGFANCVSELLTEPVAVEAPGRTLSVDVTMEFSG